MTHCFPTRRSSDFGERQPGRRLISIFCHWKLFPGNRHGAAPRLARGRQFRLNQARKGGPVLGGSGEAMPGAKPSDGTGAGTGRSEEHTSELQSLMRISYAVFCLKKKKLERK